MFRPFRKPSQLRDRMVDQQLLGRGIEDPAVLRAFREVPRHLFMPPETPHPVAYEDHPVPIGHDQTISQPYVVAWMMELLKIGSTDRVLEVGTGSGYATALLARIAGEVVSVERIPELLAQAQDRLKKLGYNNVTLELGDGSLGSSDREAFDAILVSASPLEIPASLVRQLRNDGGRLVIPVGPRKRQKLVHLQMERGEEKRTIHGGVAFVRLIGREAWKEK